MEGVNHPPFETCNEAVEKLKLFLASPPKWHAPWARLRRDRAVFAVVNEY